MKTRKELEDEFDQDGLGICEYTPAYAEALRREWAEILRTIWQGLRQAGTWNGNGTQDR
jgi:hypothetical protein